MPRYRFQGFEERILSGLSHGVNAVLHRDGGHGQPDGSTVVAAPGDELETTEPYPHAECVNVDTGTPDEGTLPEAPDAPLEVSDETPAEVVDDTPTDVAPADEKPKAKARKGTDDQPITEGA